MIDRRIKLRHVQALVEIARTGSLSGAAEALALTQPAVSKTLAELETVLGTRLMERSRAGVALTPAGEMFLHYAGASLAALAQGLDGLAQLGMRGEAVLRVGALPSVAARLLPEAAMLFRARAHGSVLSLVDGPHAHLTAELRRGALELVVGRLGEPETMAGLSFTQLYTERVAFVVRPGHPLLKAPQLARLADWPVLFPSRDAAIRPLVERMLLAHGIGALPDRIETVSGAFGRVLARRSDAVWIISEGVAAPDIAEGTLVALPFDTGLTAGPVGLMTRAGETLTPTARLFLGALSDAAETLG
ncbi:MAG: pca operon transcription factor PcaQ [Pseudomonadota bacterium]